MKQIYNKGAFRLLLALCTAGMSLTACSSDNAFSTDEDATDAKAVKVSVSTRATETNPWSNGDVITLQAYESGAAGKSQAATYTYNYGSSPWSTTDSGLFWSSYQTPLDFMGYYPATATADGLAFTLLTDQSDLQKLHAADYMTTDRIYSVSNITDKGTNVDFAFNHRLVQVVFNVTFPATTTLSDPRILSQGSGVTVTPNTDNNTSSTVKATGDITSIKPMTQSLTGVAMYIANVTPCPLTSGSTALLTLTVDGNPRQVTYNGNLAELQSGKNYVFDLKVRSEQIEITSVSTTGSFTGWGTADSETTL